MYWPEDKAWYRARVRRYIKDKDKHELHYVDDDEKETIDLKDRKRYNWRHVSAAEIASEFTTTAIVASSRSTSLAAAPSPTAKKAAKRPKVVYPLRQPEMEDMEREELDAQLEELRQNGYTEML